MARISDLYIDQSDINTGGYAFHSAGGSQGLREQPGEDHRVPIVWAARDGVLAMDDGAAKSVGAKNLPLLTPSFTARRHPSLCGLRNPDNMTPHKNGLEVLLGWEGAKS